MMTCSGNNKSDDGVAVIDHTESADDIKQQIKDLYAKKQTAELELATALSYLQDVQRQSGINGIHGSLIDREGFPIANVDHYAIRRARNTVDCRRRDLAEYSEQLLSMMQRRQGGGEESNDKQLENNKISVKDENFAYYKQIVARAKAAAEAEEENENKSRLSEHGQQRVQKNEIDADAVKKKQNNFHGHEQDALPQPQANAAVPAPLSSSWYPLFRVDSVQPTSPAAEADLQDGDIITRFGSLGPFSATDSTSDPPRTQHLKTVISQLVKDEEGCGITVEVLRGKETEMEKLELVLVPQRWAGPGLLGCILTALGE